ncbi:MULTISPECIES: pyridoxal phosphate-dependent aminotransferase [Comamonas]|uniref:Aminotransferase n=1 Tax=Comamonas avium TaxID=2762231 RepID=A0ABR8SAB4_9BURK|nr:MULTISPECIES: pyridoxal phosphate-dependent aminotransferase [Comamonas]MBD7960417.1 pyridoxal phosphate-dependent aminotransferase [Comamonas avium]MBD9401816.1 pyridoxal phosphate-dependent aminotransferase [Comamonas sp. CMM02]
MQFSTRAEKITPFYVMEVAKAAQQLAKEVASGPEPMIFLNIGEPDFTAPAQVQAAAQHSIASGQTQYTNALGLEPLREAISAWYLSRFGITVPARRIVITAGASAALQLACLALIDAGDEILMPDPSYPCNRHFVSAAEGVAKLIPTGAAERYQLSAAQVAAHWGDKTRGVLLASPSNPTGTSIEPQELRRIHEVVQAKGGVTIVDEIYLGLSYEEAFGHSALAISDDIISINSFSKYFNMTGWRLGWMVVPDAMVPVIERMAQNLFICASTISQHAALACFTPQSMAIFEERRAQFKARRDYFLPALRELGFGIDVMPDGAFYAWADCTALCKKLGVDNSWDFAYALMDKAHLAITPGRDFGTADTARYVRFSTANSMQQLQEAVRRMRKLFA